MRQIQIVEQRCRSGRSVFKKNPVSFSTGQSGQHNDFFFLRLPTASKTFFGEVRSEFICQEIYTKGAAICHPVCTASRCIWWNSTRVVHFLKGEARIERVFPDDTAAVRLDPASGAHVSPASVVLVTL